MTKEILRKSLGCLFHKHIDEFRAIDKRYCDWTNDDIVQSVLDDFVTDAVLTHINKNLVLLPVTELSIGGVRVNDYGESFEKTLGVKCFPKLFDKKVCCLGYVSTASFVSVYSCLCFHLLYVDEDGGFHNVDSCCMSGYDTKGAAVNVQNVSISSVTEPWFLFNEIVNLLPEKYEELFIIQ